MPQAAWAFTISVPLWKPVIAGDDIMDSGADGVADYIDGAPLQDRTSDS
jgi:hypothetical protein